MPDCRILVVPLDMAGQRLDVALASLLPEHSRSRLQTWIKGGRVRCEDRTLLDTKLRLRGDERLEIDEDADPATLADLPEPIPLDIVFEDEHILVINKPAGLVVHPGSGNWSGTLLNGLLAHHAKAAEIPRAGIVHRLDKETSGLMVVAKTLEAQTDLVRQLQARTVKRHYAAIVLGQPQDHGFVDAPIDRHPTQRIKMAVVPNGRDARTHYKVIERLRASAWVECRLETGRTHQIRVHMAHIGHPLLGDPVYAGRRPQPEPANSFPRQALHAFRLGLEHPATREAMEWIVPLAEDVEQLIASLREGSKA